MSDQPETIEYEGKKRRVIGRLHYQEPLAPGTLIGPNAWGETCVVLAVPDDVTLIGLAVVSDVTAASERLDEPQSLAEFRTRVLSQQVPAVFRGRP